MLSNMDPLSSNSESHVDSVVNDKRNIVPLGDNMQLLSTSDKFRRVEIFFSILNDRYTCSG